MAEPSREKIPRTPNEFGMPPATVIEQYDEGVSIHVPGSEGFDSPWKMYNYLIDGIPDDVLVREYCIGINWTYVWAESGMGVAFTARGGAPRKLRCDLRGTPLKPMAQLAKSWNLEEATLGIAALNAWYSQPEQLAGYDVRYDEPIDLPDGTKRKMDAFELYRPEITAMGDANVTVIGHFPHVEAIADYANLVVLERNPMGPGDTPDPGCEYLIPRTDFLFMTGVTLINKTAPRLLDLARDTRVVFVGPSAIMAPYLFDWGVEMLAGSVVGDPEKARFAVMAAAPQLFGEALRMSSFRNPNLQ